MKLHALDSVGFVVIGRNEGQRLADCLQSVLEVSDQVVYADSASRDGSSELAEQLGVAVTRLTNESFLTAARGRNEGYRELRRRFPHCRYVQFLDGDCILQSGWISAALEFIQAHHDVAVVCGRRFEAHPHASIFNEICDREWDTPVGEASECGGDALIRCETFDEVAGYRAELQAGEEPEMTARMRQAGWRIWRLEHPMTEHDAKMHSFSQWWRRAQRGGYGYAQVWSATGNLRHRLYGRQLISSSIWVVAVPFAAIVVALLAHRPLILAAAPFLYLLQLLRVGRRDTAPGNWVRASLLLLAKVPELLGAAKFWISGGLRRVPEYKS